MDQHGRAGRAARAHIVQIPAEKFVGGLVLEDHVVTIAAPIVAYMAKQRWTGRRVQDYCRRLGWSLQAMLTMARKPDASETSQATR